MGKIVINLDVMMARKKIIEGSGGGGGITNANLSILKNNKAKAVCLQTLEKLCKELDCQPGDLLVYEEDEE
ncbi:helix-turn-helix domain-containing protein [Clostridia bacterium]|nr:helix-turn-helix domain-containing protein [Clostridia bacterium]